MAALVLILKYNIEILIIIANLKYINSFIYKNTNKKLIYNYIKNYAKKNTGNNS